MLGLLFVAIALGLFVVHSKAPDATAAAAPGNSVPAKPTAAPRASDVSMPAPPPVESVAPARVEVPEATAMAPARHETVRAPRPGTEESSVPSATKEQASGKNRPAPPPSTSVPFNTDLEPNN
jgi:hypothetical protein